LNAAILANKAVNLSNHKAVILANNAVILSGGWLERPQPKDPRFQG